MKMTTGSGFNLNLLILLVCVGLVFVVGWYCQSSLLAQEVKIDVQEELVQQLKDTVLEQNKQLNQLQIQLQILQSQPQANYHRFNDDQELNKSNTVKHNAFKRNVINNNDKTLQLLRGRDGRDGRDGLQGPRGLTGSTGPIGLTGPPGPKGDAAGGVVYVRWGNNSCPDNGAELVYSGRAAGSHYTHKGGGGDPQCLPLDPNYLKTASGTQGWAYIFGAEYEQTNAFVPNSHDTDVVCAVCYVPTRNVVYMLPAKYTCPTGWTTEYYGYLMSEYRDHHRSTFSCVDHSLQPVIGSSTSHNGFLFYTVEGVCGALPCPPYDATSELSCAVCTK